IVGLRRRGHQGDVYAQPTDRTIAADDPDVVRYRLVERTRYRRALPEQKVARGGRLTPLLIRWSWTHPARNLPNVNRLPRKGQLRRLPTLLKQLPLKDGYDVVHCHFGCNGVRAVAARNAGLFDAPVITTFHGYDATEVPLSHGTGYYKSLFQYGDLFTVG